MLKQLLAFLTAVAVLGIAQYLTTAAWAGFAILLLMAAVTHPRHVATFIASLGVLTLCLKSPAAMAGALGLIGTASVVTGHILRAKSRSLPTTRIQPTRNLLQPPAAR